jgi:hypothetical protein
MLVEAVQIGEELTVGEPRCQLAGQPDRKGGLAHTRHPADRDRAAVAGHSRGDGEMAVKANSMSSRRRELAGHQRGAGGLSSPLRMTDQSSPGIGVGIQPGRERVNGGPARAPDPAHLQVVDLPWADAAGAG